jgi:hypothetical protein
LLFQIGTVACCRILDFELAPWFSLRNPQPETRAADFSGGSLVARQTGCTVFPNSIGNFNSRRAGLIRKKNYQ